MLNRTDVKLVGVKHPLRYKAYTFVLQTNVMRKQDSSMSLESKQLEDKFYWEVEEH